VHRKEGTERHGKCPMARHVVRRKFGMMARCPMQICRQSRRKLTVSIVLEFYVLVWLDV
jgi:hypothetical protein